MLKILIAIALLILSAPPLLSAAEQAGVAGMVIRADVMEHDAATDLIKARGKVEIVWQDMTMTADEATLNRTTQILVAIGNVYLIKAGDILWGDQLTVDTETGRSEMENGRIFMSKGNIRADGQLITKLGDNDYSLRNGGLTTCDAAVPSWKFGASKLDVTTEEYATGKHVIFYVKDIPVFYFPYIILPVKSERQSGFLFPTLGNSSKRGVFVDIPYYWAISPSQEATVNLDIQTTRGIGLGLDYRYLRSRASSGSLGGYIIHDNNEKKERGQLVQVHREQFSDSFSLATSINLTSDQTFLSDYADKSGEYNRQYYDSRAVLTKFWNQWLASTQAIYTQDFYTGSNSSTLQYAPELSLYGVREPIPYFPGLYFDMDLIMANYYREKGMEGQRAVLEPRLSSTHAFSSGRLNLSLSGGAQIRGYNVSKADPGIVESQIVIVPKAGAQISSSFSRLYNASLLDYQRLRHELVPSLSFLYVGSDNQVDVPIFDQRDRLSTQKTVSLSLASHLGGRLAKQGSAEYRTLSTLRLLQEYSFSGTRSNLMSLVDDSRPWGDLILESETWLDRSFRLLLDARYSHYEHALSSTAVGAEYNDQRGNSARASYRSVDNQLDYLEAGATLAITNPVFLSYNARYSFDKQDFLESNITLEYRHQCWSVLVGYQTRPDNRSWSFNVNLAGLFTSYNSPVAKTTPAVKRTP